MTIGAVDPYKGFFDVEDIYGRRRLAVSFASGRSDRPGLFWLAGLRSDMASTKASAVADWAAAQGITMSRFDYSGHGQSDGRFEDGTIGQWLSDAAAVFAQTKGPQILIGSSMGGWLALRLLQQAPGRIAGLVLIAPAWDMTEALMWQAMAPDARAILMREGRWVRPSDYAPDGYPITLALIEEGRQHLLADAKLAVGCPIAILHGRNDADVPFAHSLALLDKLEGQDIRLIPVADGDHRLSRPEDIALLLETIAALTK